MLGHILYFSGTGNTEYVARLFKYYFKQQNIETKVIDITKKRFISDEYDFLTLGAPVYAEFYPRYFVNWIKDKIPIGHGRKVIIFTTLAGNSSSSLNEMVEIMKEKEYKVEIATEIKMPNNYYISNIFQMPTEEDIEDRKHNAELKVEELVNDFISGNALIDSSAFIRRTIVRPVHSMFAEYSNKWAKKNLTVDMKVCVKCNKCSKNCPTQNITVGDEFIFREDCIYCLKCVNSCPVNAFRYKNRKIEQYKL